MRPGSERRPRGPTRTSSEWAAAHPTGDARFTESSDILSDFPRGGTTKSKGFHRPAAPHERLLSETSGELFTVLGIISQLTPVPQPRDFHRSIGGVPNWDRVGDA